MNTILSTLSSLTANKHTSGAGLIWLGASALKHLGPMWFPTHATQCVATADWVRDAAAAYGLVAAGDASKSAKDLKDVANATAQAIHTGNTDILTKDSLTKPPAVPDIPKP